MTWTPSKLEWELQQLHRLSIVIVATAYYHYIFLRGQIIARALIWRLENCIYSLCIVAIATNLMAFLKAHSIDYRMRTNRKIDPINKETGLGGSYDTFFLANSWGVHALHAAAVSWPWNMHACMRTAYWLLAAAVKLLLLLLLLDFDLTLQNAFFSPNWMRCLFNAMKITPRHRDFFVWHAVTLIK